MVFREKKRDLKYNIDNTHIEIDIPLFRGPSLMDACARSTYNKPNNNHAKIKVRMMFSD
jgi:hypothetical protein